MTEKELAILKKKFSLKCKKCEYVFLPWDAFMITKPENNMQPYIYCPKCGNCDDVENFKIF